MHKKVYLLVSLLLFFSTYLTANKWDWKKWQQDITKNFSTDKFHEQLYASYTQKNWKEFLRLIYKWGINSFYKNRPKPVTHVVHHFMAIFAMIYIDMGAKYSDFNEEEPTDLIQKILGILREQNYPPAKLIPL